MQAGDWRSNKKTLWTARRAAIVLCASIVLAACGHDDGGSATPTGAAVGGTITGIAVGARVALTNNGGDAVTVTSDGAFAFPTRLQANQPYAVAVQSTSSGTVCAILHERGTVVDANPIASVAVLCGPAEQRTFKPAAALHAPRENHRLVKLPDGTIYAFGGTDAVTFLSVSVAGHTTLPVERYDSKVDRWTDAGSLPTAATVKFAFAVPGNKVLLIVTNGPDTSTPTTSWMLYDIATTALTAAPSPTTLTQAAAAVVLLDARVLVSEGQKVEIYDASTNRWTATGSTVAPHSGTDLVLMNDGNVLVDGGVAATEIYDVRAGAWTVVGQPTTPRLNPQHVLLPGGRIMLFGGGDAVFSRVDLLGIGRPINSYEIFDPSVRRWILGGPTIQPTANATLTLLPTGKVLIAGGEFSASPEELFFAFRNLKVVKTSVLYDPTTDTITPAGDMDVPRTMHAAILTNEGRALVTGGYFYTPLHAPLPLDQTDFSVTLATSSELFW